MARLRSEVTVSLQCDERGMSSLVDVLESTTTGSMLGGEARLPFIDRHRNPPDAAARCTVLMGSRFLHRIRILHDSRWKKHSRMREREPKCEPKVQALDGRGIRLEVGSRLVLLCYGVINELLDVYRWKSDL